MTILERSKCKLFKHPPTETLDQNRMRLAKDRATVSYQFCPKGDVGLGAQVCRVGEAWHVCGHVERCVVGVGVHGEGDHVHEVLQTGRAGRTYYMVASRGI